MYQYCAIYQKTNYLAHHGVKGQKWGVRRYQNEDGTLNAAGIKRYRTQYARKIDTGAKHLGNTVAGIGAAKNIISGLGSAAVSAALGYPKTAAMYAVSGFAAAALNTAIVTGISKATRQAVLYGYRKSYDRRNSNSR